MPNASRLNSRELQPGKEQHAGCSRHQPRSGRLLNSSTPIRRSVDETFPPTDPTCSSKPLVSAVLLSYNAARFVAAALNSVLNQDCQPLEIVVSDDASTDGTYEILKGLLTSYSGPHRVHLRRRATNSGSKSAHFNDVLHHTTGEILISFDADDVSEPSRVVKIQQAFASDSTVQAVYSSYSLIALDGHRIGSGRVPHPSRPRETRRWFARVDAYAAGTTLAFRREVVDAFGPLDPAINEDVVIPFRASLLGEVFYIDEELVGVRRWDGSLTASPGRFDSVESYRSRMLQGIAAAKCQLDSRLADLDRAVQLMPDRVSDFDELRRIAEKTFTSAEATADLLSPSLRTRLRCLAALFRAGAYHDELGRHLWLAVSPGTYLRYKRGRRAVDRADGSGR
jgi:glycosyltransferase involved in cell wall biosynthesis